MTYQHIIKPCECETPVPFNKEEATPELATKLITEWGHVPSSPIDVCKTCRRPIKGDEK